MDTIVISDIPVKPWFQLNPNDYTTQWWRSSNIINNNYTQLYKDEKDILCHFILQDCNIAGEYWRVSTWYENDPNRYSQILFQNEWKFSKSLIDMKEHDIVHLNTNTDIKFKVSLCSFLIQENQINFCKILERV